MKRIVLLFALVFSAGILSAQTAQTFPAVTVEDQKGEAFNTADLIGERPVIISFWSTVCKPCIQELDTINDLMEDWLEEVDFTMVAVSVDDARSASKARSLASGRGWEFTTLYDKNQDFQRAMNVTSQPHVFVVDKNGKIIYSHNGYTPGSEIELLQKVKQAVSH